MRLGAARVSRRRAGRLSRGEPRSAMDNAIASLAAPSPKVFGIGFHKTGTTSLADALAGLGYRVTGPDGLGDPDIAANALPMALRIACQFDAFQDNPWPVLFREMDAAFPGSRFVLTVRSPEAWMASVIRHFGASSTPMRRWIYGAGSPLGAEATYRARYDRHNQEVVDFFAGRPRDLLVLRITEGEGWERLCPFLDRQPPDRAFPHSNRAA